MKLHFIVNPVAKNGIAMKTWGKLKKQLEKRNMNYEERFTSQPGDGEAFARQIASETNDEAVIIAVGGDGTANEVIHGINGHPKGVAGFIPAGSGNDFCRGYHLPRNPKKALEFIINSSRDKKYKKYDNGRYHISHKSGIFVNNLGCGFDALVAKSANESILKPILNRIFLGKLVYVYSLLKELVKFKPSKLTVEIDGKVLEFHKTWFVTICNHPYFGGGMKISPDSKPDDQQFEVVIVHDVSKLKIMLLFITVFWGQHTRLKEVSFFTGRNILIKNEAKFPVHADGDHIGYESVDVKLQEEFVTLLS